MLEVLAEFLPGVGLPKGRELTPEEKKTNEYWQDRFVQYMREIFERRSLHFDCSMLQKRVVGRMSSAKRKMTSRLFGRETGIR